MTNTRAANHRAKTPSFSLSASANAAHATPRSSVDVLDLSLLTGTLDHAGKIDNGQREGEVDASKHDGEEYVPSEKARDKREGAGSFLTLCRNSRVALTELEEGTGEETESGGEGEEDKEEDQVGSHRADEVYEAEHAHADHEVACIEFVSWGLCLDGLRRTYQVRR